MAQFTEGKITIIRCPQKDECESISKSFPIFENFNLKPTEYLIDRIAFKKIILIVKAADFVVLVYCIHTEPKLGKILQCLKHTKTVITGNFKKTALPDALQHFTEFPTSDVDNLASYVHANFNYDSMSNKAKKQRNAEESYPRHHRDPPNSPLILKNNNKICSSNTLTINDDKTEDLRCLESTCFHTDMDKGLYVW